MPPKDIDAVLAEGIEKRQHERAPVTLVVDYDGAEDFVSDYTENLSTGGTFIHTTRVLERDTTIRLILSFPGLLEPVKIDGIVRWSRAGGHPGVGIEFLADTGRDKLAAVVEKIQRGEPGTVVRLVKVLVVEDNPHISQLICNGLSAMARRSARKEFDFSFETADNGASALDILKTKTFDIAIIDVYLPVLDGAQVIDQARARLGLMDLPIIAVSDGGEHARGVALAAGANMFLDKPMQLRQVVDTMRQLVNFERVGE